MHIIFGLLGALLKRTPLPILILAVGWYGGAKFGAPDVVMRAADAAIERGVAMLGPLLNRGGEVAVDALEDGGEAAVDVLADGGEYVVGTVEQMLTDFVENAENAESADTSSGPAPTPTEQAADGGDAPAEKSEPAEETAPAPAPAPSEPAPTYAGGDIILCQMRVSNPPSADGDGNVRKTGSVRLSGVRLLLMPATQSCLSSGYGNRNGRLHRGVDYYSDSGGDVLAGGGGVIREAVSRSDYGNMVVIDHGNGVYTRYAHLRSFASGIREGANVSSGQRLGPIGQTGGTSITHLHYEVLQGDYETNAKSFGLDAIDPFSLPSG